MGREVDVGIYDRLNNTYTFDEFDGWHICGRNDFTNDLYSLFINREVELLILDIYGDKLDGKIIEACKDLGKSHFEDDKAMFIDVSKMEDIIKNHIQIIRKEREELHSRIESLEKVRNNTRTLQDWLDIDTFLKELKDTKDDISWSGQEDLHKYLDDARRECSGRKDNLIAIDGYLMGPDPFGRSNTIHRFYPIVLFSD